MRANLAVLIFSLKKKEACFFNSWKEGVGMVLDLLKMDDMIFDVSQTKMRE